ncbi:hypothetical protein [Desulfotalea psychrophila]|uniref:hypothetical protein n=1 Tax=Desulfotalea psychrophila TaxID=84980 RepID=UPI0002F52040|nr:hypothetical protein [Desulfotalea psychrophila]
MEKFPKMDLRQGMEIWKEQAQSQADATHLSEEELARAAVHGGLAELDGYLIEHLASCPVCLAKWVAACRDIDMSKDEFAYDTADDWYSGGLLEAAATSGSRLPAVLLSRCGNFNLRIFPDEKSTGAMVALETRNPSATGRSEGKMVTVQDAEGKIIVEGKIISGRFARMVDNLDGFNLQVWSLMIKQG